MSTDMAALADRLKEWRSAAGLTQDAASKAIGITQQSLSEWERGTARPGVRRAPTIARVYGLEVSDVLAAIGEVGPGEPSADGASDDEVQVDFNSKIARLPPEDREYVLGLVERLLRERD